MLFPRIYIGTSGWDYDDWLDVFYESERGMFTYYARFFNTVEINSSFYSLLGEKFYKGLAEAAPEGFVFSLKMYQGITHKRLLNPRLVEKELDFFLKSIEPLRAAGKLGAVLIQMPPRSRREIPWFNEFLDMLPSNVRFAVEFRDESWLSEDIFKRLADRNIAYTVVDEPLLPPVVRITADFGYFRWHGRGERPWYYYHYSLEELKGWASKISEVIGEVKMLLGYFNNHFRGFAPHNALQMVVLLGIANKRQREKLEEMEKYFASAPRKYERELQEALSSGDLDKALRLLAGERRFERATGISDSEVKYTLQGGVLRGTVKQYFVGVDPGGRRIVHDCEDWRKSLETKRLCKHIVKLFQVLPREYSLNVLRDFAENMDEWTFEYGRSI
ncbi:protein of unknown function DUF72 [Thermofilum pendens Hrk 5]|uniref:DUF72 domain-containing protein n=1 Tax=Thermofilum pendens (strain DSM 2475 / Hrk 5) TaxID=368408 RepID=A1RWG8_THEPD|nr:protein of unknown function DUF72 [Thermofilum pendens Hrk 5]